MDQYGTPHLPGTLPTAQWRLEVLLMPDGSLWGAVIEGRDPTGALIALETFPGTVAVDDGFRLVQARTRFMQLVAESRSALRLADRGSDTVQPPHDNGG